MWDHRTSVMALCPGLADKPLQLWPRVLRATEVLQIHDARKAVGLLPMMQSESTSCERFLLPLSVRNSI